MSNPLFAIDLTIDGAPHSFALRMPLWSETYSAIKPLALQTDDRAARLLSMLVFDFLRSDDQRARPPLATIKQWVAQPTIAAAFGAHIAALLERTTDLGSVLFECPGCAADVALCPSQLAGAMGVAVPPVYRGAFFAVPPLATLSPPPLLLGSSLRATPRAPLPGSDVPTERVRFSLPSHALPLAAPLREGWLRALDTSPDKPRETAAWHKWHAPPDVSASSERASRTTSFPGFVVTIRLCVALEDTRNGDVTPATIDAMPICDVFFLSTIYWLVYVARATQPSLIECPACRTRFTPKARRQQ